MYETFFTASATLDYVAKGLLSICQESAMRMDSISEKSRGVLGYV